MCKLKLHARIHVYRYVYMEYVTVYTCKRTLSAVAEGSGPSTGLITGEYPRLTSHVTANCCHVNTALQPRITRRHQVRTTYR